jgi:hypothetical protein
VLSSLHNRTTLSYPVVHRHQIPYSSVLAGGAPHGCNIRYDIVSYMSGIPSNQSVDGRGYEPQDRLITYLHQFEPFPALRLTICYRHVGEERRMTDDGRECIPMLMGEPFTGKLV